ncbi:MAG: hypothetical protein QXW97_03580 [Candidatus Pacearchaeota archaeon]
MKNAIYNNMRETDFRFLEENNVTRFTIDRCINEFSQYNSKKGNKKNTITDLIFAEFENIKDLMGYDLTSLKELNREIYPAHFKTRLGFTLLPFAHKRQY